MENLMDKAPESKGAKPEKFEANVFGALESMAMEVAQFIPFIDFFG